MSNLSLLMGARVETPPNRERVIIISRPGTTSAWQATLPRVLDQRLATATLVEYVVRLFQRQRPSEAAAVGLLGLAVVVRMALKRANETNGKAGVWEWAQEVS
ncbi:MAG: hypothetical protein ACRYFR_16020 [Janthinobacterium lividum]